MSRSGGGSRTDRDRQGVLLSRACASQDQFPDFEKRGDSFRALVQTLLGGS